MITANTCPYCGAAYTIATAGCAARCAISESLKRIIRLACEADERTDWSRRG